MYLEIRGGSLGNYARKYMGVDRMVYDHVYRRYFSDIGRC